MIVVQVIAVIREFVTILRDDAWAAEAFSELKEFCLRNISVDNHSRSFRARKLGRPTVERIDFEAIHLIAAEIESQYGSN